ncbi:hypothetical protein IWZ00DRAFT_20569 [Phyllosticta capitalensis]
MNLPCGGGCTVLRKTPRRQSNSVVYRMFLRYFLPIVLLILLPLFSQGFLAFPCSCSCASSLLFSSRTPLSPRDQPLACAIDESSTESSTLPPVKQEECFDAFGFFTVDLSKAQAAAIFEGAPSEGV